MSYAQPLLLAAFICIPACVMADANTDKFTGTVLKDTNSTLTLTRVKKSEEKIVNDPFICGPVERNSFKDLTSNLRDRYDTTLKESYFLIECGGKDLMGLVVNSAMDSSMVSIHLQKYFERDEQIPEMFSRILMNEVNTRSILTRIEYEIKAVQANPVLKGTKYETRLLNMQQKYTNYLKKYPIQ